MTRFLAALTIAAGLVILAGTSFLLGQATSKMTPRSSSPASCLEDEVRMHDGRCVALDDITEAAIDLYVEANMQAARR